MKIFKKILSKVLFFDPEKEAKTAYIKLFLDKYKKGGIKNVRINRGF